MKVIGITGGVGAGKSSVLALLKEMCSCDIIQADLVARNIYHSGNIGFKKVVDIFGEQIVGEDGEINRPLLADIIFKNPNKRIVLNSIIHPLVKQEIINQINNHKIAGDVDYCFVEAALLIEDHYDIFMDEIWYIYVSEDERRKRLAASRGYSDEKISDIFKSQLSDAEFRKHADKVINNGAGFVRMRWNRWWGYPASMTFTRPLTTTKPLMRSQKPHSLSSIAGLAPPWDWIAPSLSCPCVATRPVRCVSSTSSSDRC